ncbi:MAG: AmmeMemoRadiSam system protein B [Sphaerochaeta sp.]
MKRQQIFAGTWYPSDKSQLEKLIEVIPVSDNVDLFGVVPHAGLYYSANLIKVFFSSLLPSIDKVLLITPSHYYALPDDKVGSGNIESFDCLINDISGFNLSTFESGYEEVTKAEHAVEMIIPFIAQRKNVSLCCAHVNHFTDVNIAHEYAKKIISEIDDRTAVIASSDFTHYGRNFRYTPYGTTITEQVEHHTAEYDKTIASQFAACDGVNAYKKAIKDRATICGIAPMLLVSEMAKINKMQGRILGQSDSLEQMNKEENFVSYISIAWRK